MLRGHLFFSAAAEVAREVVGTCTFRLKIRKAPLTARGDSDSPSGKGWALPRV